MAMAETERTMRELGRGVAGPGRLIDVAGVVALTDPGPAAAGIVVTDGQGRLLAHRAHYLGTTSRRDAAVQALLGATRLAREGGLVAPVLRVDEPDLAASVQPQSGADGADGADDDGPAARGRHWSERNTRQVELSPPIWKWKPKRNVIVFER